MSQQETVPVGPEPRDQSTSTASYSPATAQTTNSSAIVQPLKIICPLHGIRTLAVWQKGLSDLAGSRGWVCRLDRWSYGRFSLLAFLTPWTREAKLNWLRRQYDAEINDRRLDIEQGQTPSVVAHSFGTYILGYTLIRFDFIRFNKVILCGSILPRDFPWDKLIERGQVQAIRNEYGVRDPWVKRVRWFVRGTGPSGASGFTCKHDRLEQEEFEYDHGDYFGIDHMDDRWIPFLSRPLREISRSKDGPRIPRPPTTAPWGLYGLVLAALAIVALLTGSLWGRWRRTPKADQPHATRPAEAGTRRSRIPSVEDLTSIAAALQELLATFAKYKLFLDKTSDPLDNVMPQHAMLESLCRLEKLLNPRRLPYGSPELAGFVIRAWPYEVMTAYPKLKSHVYRIIQRWDIPEICQDRPFMRGKYGITQDDGTIKEIDRPTRPYTLTSVECDELTWVLNALLGVLQGADQATPNPAVSPPGERGEKPRHKRQEPV